MVENRSARLRRWSLVLGGSVVAMAVASPALAQCAPDPTVAGGTTNCSGTDSDGLTVATSGTSVFVAAGATVRAGTAAAAITAMSSSSSLTINGLVDGGTKPGLLVTNAAPITYGCDPYAGAVPRPCSGSSIGYPATSISILVGANGVLTGSQALLAQRPTTDYLGPINVQLTNSGRLVGTTGPALVFEAGSTTASISNLTGGYIGGISAPLTYFTNAGTVDGGNGSAITSSATSLLIANNGSIVSNAGTTTASVIGSLAVTNAAGATIGGGSTALRASGALTLTNAGTINGAIVSTAVTGQNSTIDTAAGIINGNVTLGAGDDTLIARFDPATGVIASVTGTVDGGAGRDTLVLGLDHDATIGAIALPTNFEALGLNLSNNATVTLASALSGTGFTLSSNGGSGGTVINEGSITTNGVAVSASGYSPAFVNQGTISVTITDASQFAVATPFRVTNSGTITSLGGGGAQGWFSLTNSGDITASGTAASVTFGTLTNSGTIRSTGGIGAVVVGQAPYTPSSNSGSITGASAGARVSSATLTNDGTILGGVSGVLLDNSGRLINNAGGIVTGATNGVANVGYNAGILNAGTINGNVNLATSLATDSSNDIFIDKGGTVNGAVLLGGGDDILVVDLVPVAGRPLAGASGGVDAGAGYNSIHYRVNADASVDIALPTSFSALAYELDNNAALTLTAPQPMTTTIGLAGNGSVTLNGTISATNRTLIDATALTTDQLMGIGTGPARALTITNNGTLTLTNTQSFGYPGTYAVTAGTADFTNTGTITVSSVAGAYYPAGAILSGTNVTNSGTITITGGTAINGATNVVNSGTLTDVAGSNGSGISSVTLTNSGTIRFDQVALTSNGNYNAAAIINSGTIESRLADAIMLLGYGGTLTNTSSGVITGAGTAISVLSSTILNSGTINGNVISSPYGYYGVTFVSAGGTLNGDLLFGSGNDFLIAQDGALGITGKIDGGSGTDTFVHRAATTASIAIGSALPTNFEIEAVEALGADTVVTVTGPASAIATPIAFYGDGTILNQVDVTAGTSLTSNIVQLGGPLQGGTGALAFTNSATLAGGVQGTARSFDNSGTITSAANRYGSGVQLTAPSDQAFAFSNSGTISSTPGTTAVQIQNGGYDYAVARNATLANSGTISGGLYASAIGNLTLTNTGTLQDGDDGQFAAILYDSLDSALPTAPTTTITNTGTLSSTGKGSGAIFANVGPYTTAPTDATALARIDVINSGTITSSGDALFNSGLPFAPVGIYLTTYRPAVLSVTNQAGGTISAPGGGGVAIATLAVGRGSTFQLDNAGAIIGGGAAGTAPTMDSGAYPYYYAIVNTSGVAIMATGGVTSQIRNTGTITGAILLGDGDDMIENRGTITGNVYMGAGNDTFLQLAGTVIGTVDGGAGFDSVTIDTANSGTIDASQFINFERFTQTGSGTATYTGAFTAQSFGISGGGLTVAQGASLTSSDAVTIAADDAGAQVTNGGTISGSVVMGAGNDSVVNRGTIGGAVALGAGDDSFTEGAGSHVAGGVDGGIGSNTYIAELAGDRTGLGQRSNFQNLGVTGSGTLTLTLDQSWQKVMLAGGNLSLTLAGFTVGAVTGGDGADQFTADGDIASAALGGGDDSLALRTNILAGIYDGGSGSNGLYTTAGGPVTLSGSIGNFSLIDLAGGALTITGTLAGAQGGTTLAGTDHSMSIARGATVSGNISLGAGANSLRVLAGSTVTATIIGSDGTTPAAIDLVNDGGAFAFAGSLSGFGTARISGGGTVELDGAFAANTTSFDGNLTIGAAGSLTSPTVTGGAANSTVTIAGSFTGAMDLGSGNTILRLVGAPTIVGSIAGGGGTDAIELAVSGTDAAPTSFGANAAFTGFATLRTTAGVASLAGTRSFTSNIEVGAGSRLIGQAGSVFTAPQINVAAGGTFGSAGTVNGNIAVAGTLSPGASPGTMTVNGNVALASGSTGLFELTTGVSDKLLVSGTLTIAAGSTLTLTGNRPLTPGVTLDLIVANGGISGSFSTVNQPSGIGGFLSQTADRLSLLGTFQTSAKFVPQVDRAIDGVNGLLISGQASSAILAAVPQLLVNGATNAQAFAQISPEPFATAMELGTENGLSLIDAVRGQTRSRPTSAGLFSFAQGLGYRYSARGNGGEGTNDARLSATGGLAGVGFGSGIASVGLFIGYGESHQRIAALGSKLDARGLLAGLQADAGFAGFKVTALAAYDNSNAHLDRAVQGDARSSFGLHSGIGDVTVRYSLPLAPGVTIEPRVGLSYVHTDRGSVAEGGSSLYKLDLASQTQDRWFVDGGADIAGAIGPVHAFAGLGVRRRLGDHDTLASATFAGTTSSVTGLGLLPSRTMVLGNAGGSVNLSQALSLSASYTGAFAHTARHSVTVGLRLAM